MFLDLRGLPTQHLPELWGLLALHQECDFCLPFPLILVNFLCKEPDDRWKVLSKAMLFSGIPSFAQNIPKDPPTWPWWYCSVWPGPPATHRYPVLGPGGTQIWIGRKSCNVTNSLSLTQKVGLWPFLGRPQAFLPSSEETVKIASS